MIAALLANRLIIVALVCSLGSSFATWKVMDWKHGKQLAEIENATWQMQVNNLNAKNEIDLHNNRATLAEAENIELAKQKQKVVTKYLTKEVIKYVKNDDAGKCVLPYEWVRIHDTAARNSITGDADTTTSTNDIAARVTDIDALEVVTDNYQTCNAIRDQLKGLQAWAKSIK